MGILTTEIRRPKNTRFPATENFLFVSLLPRCHSAHLNGVYYRGGHYSAVTDDGVVWYPWRGWWYSLKTTIMKLRPADFRMDPVNDPNAVCCTPLS